MRREAPSCSEFHEVTMPAMPAATMRFAKNWLPNNAPIASAAGKLEPAISSCVSADETVRTIMMYQAAAMSTEMNEMLPTLRGGMFTSSAACGITSKPTKRNGTTMSTAKKPPAPPVKKGSKFAPSPPVNAPTICSAPMAKRKMTTNICTPPATFTPRLLMSVMSTATTEPTRAQTR